MVYPPIILRRGAWACQWAGAVAAVAVMAASASWGAGTAAPLASPPASSVHTHPAQPPSPPGARFEGCPAAAIRAAVSQALKAAGDGGLAADALAVAKSAQTLCAARSHRIGEILHNEKEIADLRAEIEAARLAATRPPAPPAASAKPAAVAKAAPPLKKAAAPGRKASKGPAPRRKRWYVRSVYGHGDDLTAGIADASGDVWFVKPGDELPGGARLVSIRLRPTRVTISRRGEAVLLAREPRGAPRPASGTGGRR